MRLPAGLRAAVSVMVGLGFLPPITLAQDLETAVSESYPTNLTLLEETTKSAVAELFLGFSAPEGITILLESADTHQANWFVENHVLAHLTGAGYQAYLKEITEIPGILPDQEPDAELDSLGVDADSVGVDSVGVGDDEQLIEGLEEDPPPEDVEDTVDDEPRPEFVLRFRIVEFEVAYPDNYRTSPLGSRKVQRRASVSILAHLLRGQRENVVWVGNGDVERMDVVPSSKLPLLEGPSYPFDAPALETRGMGSLVEPALVTGIVVGLIYLFYTNQN